jgi:protein TonB
MRVLAEQNRTFGYAVAASAALHAFLLLNLPAWRESPPAPAEPPLVAHLAQPPAAVPAAAPPPAPPPEVEKREPAKPVPPKRKARSKPKPAPRVATPSPSPLPAPAEDREEQHTEAPPAALPSAPAVSAAPVAPPVAATAPPAAAPDPAAALARFRDGIREVAGRYKRYPRAALDNGWTGDVIVLIDVGASGSVSSIRVKTSSGYEVLDAQALEMFSSAVPQVPVPAALRGRAFSVELRAVYNLRDRPG